MQEENNWSSIEKEQVGILQFPKEDVLGDKESKANREVSLKRATSAGNLEKVKFKIYFEDGMGKKVVHTTIWATTEENILLKNNVAIPIRRIYNVDIG